MMIYDNEIYEACATCGAVYIDVPENEHQVCLQSPVFEKFSHRNLTAQDAIDAVRKLKQSWGEETQPIDVHEFALNMFFSDGTARFTDGVYDKPPQEVKKQLQNALFHFVGHFLYDNYDFVEMAMKKYNNMVRQSETSVQ